ncbi:MAG: DUF1501 domain-containing protein [Verrucomicrobiales bacterium]|nr:DUF1501 domain-containing protein [Verrucomicrobiales bacterium]
MNSFNIHKPKWSRRQFLSRTGSAGFGVTGLASTLTNLNLIQNASAASTGMNMGDYKALVCFFLAGGCDTNNVLIPIGNHSGRSNYEADRRFVAVSEAEIANAGTALNAPSSIDQQYALHPSCQAMSQMFNAGELAMIANCGTLAVPIPENVSLNQYNATVKPIQLFSHSDQVNEWFSSIPQNPFVSGWAGRVADLFRSSAYADPAPGGQGINKDSVASMLVTAAGGTDLLVSPGGAIPQYAVSRSGAISFAGYGTNYSAALTDGAYQSNSSGRRLKAFESIINYQHEHILEQGYSEVLKSARENEELIGAATNVADSADDGPFPTDNYLETVFLDTYNGLLGTNFTARTQLPGDVQEMLITCKLIAGRECLGNTRQVFFMNKGGFDTHADINDVLPGLLADVDAIVACYNEAMKALAQYDSEFDYNMVTLFQASDFNRTWTPNTSGTDHAWGTHTFVCGGAVADANAGGSQIYGKFPELAVQGANDVPGNNNRGRWIPQISTDQYYARLAKWFGVSSGDMEAIFPNLANGFTSPFAPEANLDFIGLT